MNAIDNARRVIEERLAELDKERDQLVGALRALEPGRKPAAKASVPRTRRKRGAHKRNGKRAARGQRQEEFLSDLSTNPGATMTEIARRIGVSPQQLYPIAHKLEDKGAIVKTDDGYAVQAKDGSARGTAGG